MALPLQLAAQPIQGKKFFNEAPPAFVVDESWLQGPSPGELRKQLITN